MIYTIINRKSNNFYEVEKRINVTVMMLFFRLFLRYEKLMLSEEFLFMAGNNPFFPGKRVVTPYLNG